MKTILIIGHPNSSHVKSWLNLIENDKKIYFLSIQDECPQVEIKVDTLFNCSLYYSSLSNVNNIFAIKYCDNLFKLLRKIGVWNDNKKITDSFSKITRKLNPDIIHFIGIEDTKRLLNNENLYNDLRAKTILQTRGGSDFFYRKNLNSFKEFCKKIASFIDLIVTDNLFNIEYLQNNGFTSSQISDISPCPGSGGPLEVLDKCPDKKNIIVVPKSYESQWSKILPVLEALRQCKNELSSFEIHFFCCSDEFKEYFQVLPEWLQNKSYLHKRVSREKFLNTLSKSRILLAPSLVDGIPNVLYEAMANFVLPIISPLETITPSFKEGENVLYARNLYPNEIRDQLLKALINSDQVSSILENNNFKVRQFASEVLKIKINQLYN